ncbi:MAG: hypothetical protein U0353_07665 [Sandaracinus sp.]
MQERALRIAIALAGVVLVMLGAHRAWQRWGAPAAADTLTLPASAIAPVPPLASIPSGLADDPPATLEDGFLVATLRESLEPQPPPRVPASLDDPWPASFADDLCAGRAASWESLSALLDARATPLDDALVSRLADASAHGCYDPEGGAACTFAQRALEGTDTSRAPLAWSLLAHCPDEVALPLLDRVDAPAPAILRFLVTREALGVRPVRLPAYALQSVTHALAQRAGPDEPFPFHELAAALGHYDDPNATRALVQMYEVAPGYARESIGVAIRFPDDDRSRAIHQESCATVPADTYVLACNDGSLAARVGTYELDVHLELARHPEEHDELVAALESCAAHAEDPGAGMMCFRRLAELDRERAASVASSRIAQANLPLLGLPAVSAPQPFVTSLEAEVRRFPSEGAMTAALASAGISSAPTPALARHPASMLEALAARGHALLIDEETGTFPTPHDVLLRRLARMVAPALDAVVFDQVSPDESQMAVGRYSLRAHLEGRVLETYARNYGDFYDLEAVVGLIDALLVRRGALDRCVIARDDAAAGTAIVCASLPQLRALESAGILFATSESP